MSLGGRPTARGLAPQRVIKPADPMNDATRRANYAVQAMGGSPEIRHLIGHHPYAQQMPLTPAQRRRASKKLGHAQAARPPRPERAPAAPQPGGLRPFIANLQWNHRVWAKLHPPKAPDREHPRDRRPR